YASGAPPPHFFQDSTAERVRHVAQSLRDPLLRLSWVETVLAGLHMIEDFFKRHPTHRLLFSDFLFHIEQDLQDAAKDYDALFKASEGEMTRRIAEIKSRFDEMAREIREVRQQVEERL
ncbi:MAG TPA: hypothetical protein VLR94_04955, partial [Acidobacteriota bacterium]|nr:hypothetical protein [Acidobacteriota bacterium]